MEQDFSQGINPSPYDQDRQRRGAWNEQAPFSTAYPSDPITQLPPIQTQRTAFDQSPTSYDPVRRPTPIATTMGQSFSPYATQQPPQSPYGHGISPYQHNPHMFNQYPASSFSPIRPMPALATGQPPHSMSASYASPTGYTFQSQGEDPEPQQRLLHVVGSQGRRGVLPSDEGRPSAVANGATGTKSTIIPKKDADGKFPCPHCQKTYLHGKHLKRHLLRHTGDRPYSCFLCQDTFSRSDILKRHFQKCSQRRGNPTGASHLAYSQNHLKRQAAKAKQQQQQQQHVSPQDSQIPPTTTDPDLPVVTQATINNDAATIFADSSVGMGTINAIQHHLANISTKNYGNDIHDSTSGTLTSPALNRPNHNFLSGQPGPASLPSSGSSTPLTAKTMSGQFPHTFQSDSTNRASFAEPTIRNHQPPQGTQFDGNGFEWSPPFASGKDNQERASSINQNINVQE